jgi:phytol kinase
MQFFSESAASEIPLAVLIAGVVLAGLWISNIVYDGGVPNYVSRKIGHSAGGVAFLISYAFSSSGWPIIISAVFGALLLSVRLAKPGVLRGVGGTGRSDRAMAEVWFPWVAVPVYGVAWLWLERPAVAVAGLLFMAWGDGVTGLVRSRIYKRAVKGMWGSLAMFGVCLVIAGVFIRPFWIGVVASAVAVIIEWAFGENGILKWADDNWAIPLASTGTILGLMALAGIL